MTKKALSVVAIFAVCIICTVVIVTQLTIGVGSGREYSITEPYDYESIITSAQWRGNPMRHERGEELAIPEEVFENMTTEALLKSIASYPFLIDMTSFGSTRTGFLTLYKERGELYPEINELVSRDDFGLTLIKEYSDMHVIHPESEYNIHLEFMEILIAQPEVTGGLSDSDIRTLVEIAKQKFDEKAAADHIYSNPKTFYKAVNENKGTALQLAVKDIFGII